MPPVWALPVSNVTIDHLQHPTVNKLEQLVSSFAKKWLSLRRSITNTALYGKGDLELPVLSLKEEFKCFNMRLKMAECQDRVVAKTIPTCQQLSRGGLGTRENRPSWLKATPSQHQGLVVDEVHRQEQVMRCTKAITHAKQGQWMR